MIGRRVWKIPRNRKFFRATRRVHARLYRSRLIAECGGFGRLPGSFERSGVPTIITSPIFFHDAALISPCAFIFSRRFGRMFLFYRAVRDGSLAKTRFFKRSKSINRLRRAFVSSLIAAAIENACSSIYLLIHLRDNASRFRVNINA